MNRVVFLLTIQHLRNPVDAVGRFIQHNNIKNNIGLTVPQHVVNQCLKIFDILVNHQQLARLCDIQIIKQLIILSLIAVFH